MDKVQKAEALKNQTVIMGNELSQIQVSRDDQEPCLISLWFIHKDGTYSLIKKEGTLYPANEENAKAMISRCHIEIWRFRHVEGKLA